MEIGILTHHAVHNHGAMLQMYALIRVLREKGHQVRALDFKRNFDYIGAELEKKYSVSLKSIPYYTKYLMKNGINKTFYNYRKVKYSMGFPPSTRWLESISPKHGGRCFCWEAMRCSAST